MDSAAEQQAAALPRRSRLAGCLHVQAPSRGFSLGDFREKSGVREGPGG
jgi:hypothetical protein